MIIFLEQNNTFLFNNALKTTHESASKRKLEIPVLFHLGTGPVRLIVVSDESANKFIAETEDQIIIPPLSSKVV